MDGVLADILIQAIESSDLGSGFLKMIAVIMFALGMIQCFYGFKLFKFWVAVSGFFAFGAIGSLLSISMGGETGVIIFWGLIAAILGAIIAYKLYRLGVFILCGSMGFLLGFLLTQEMFLGIIMGIIIGIVSLFFIKPVIIISTSISGGIAAGTSLSVLLGIEQSTGMVAAIIFIALGLFVQFKMNQDNIPKKQGLIQEDTILKQSNEQLLLAREAVSKEISNNAARLQSKIEQDCLSAMKTCKKVSVEEVLDNLKYIMYSNRLLKYVMPFIEYVLYIITLLICGDLIFGRATYGIYSNALLVILAILCFAKKKYGAIGLSFALISIARIMMVCRFDYIYNLPYFLIDTGILGYIAFIALTSYFKSTNTTNLKGALYALVDEIKLTVKDKKVVEQEVAAEAKNEAEEAMECPKCGKINKVTSKFCNNCGEKITPFNIHNEDNKLDIEGNDN